MKTVIQDLIQELNNIKETKCKSLLEKLFYDGVLAIIESEYIEKEKEQLIKFAYSQIENIEAEKGDCVYKKVPEELFNETFKS